MDANQVKPVAVGETAIKNVMIAAYFERNQILIPPATRRILHALPPKPPTSDQIRWRVLDKASTVNLTEIGSPK